MASNNRSQLQEQWPSLDSPAVPVIPPDTESRRISTSSSTDISNIRGNVSDSSKRLVLAMLAYYIGEKEESFGVEVGKRLRMHSMNVRGSSGSRRVEAQTIFEITVTKGEHINGNHLFFSTESFFSVDMCNPFGTLHGACACYIVDP